MSKPETRINLFIRLFLNTFLTIFKPILFNLFLTYFRKQTKPAVYMKSAVFEKCKTALCMKTAVLHFSQTAFSGKTQCCCLFENYSFPAQYMFRFVFGNCIAHMKCILFCSKHVKHNCFVERYDCLEQCIC